MTRPRVTPLLAACVVLGALAGCAPQVQSARSRATAAQIAACRHRADEVWQQQNRSEVYRSDSWATSTRDSPFAGAGLPGTVSSGLSGQYAREQMLDNCLNSATGSGGTAAQEPEQPDPLSGR
jgi:hypothetical protein